jgi:beta-lactamase regulating signal transducer with metallopeptidase domain
MNEMINLLVTASAKGAAWLLVWSWQAAVLLACVWAGLKIFRVKSPALRHQVWLFALIAVAAMPILGGVVQNLLLPQPSHRALSYAVELPRIVVTNAAAPVVQNLSPAASAKPSSKQPIILGLLFALWFAGALVFVAKAAINVARLRRLRDGARRASLADLDCDECDSEALRNGKVGLAFSNEIHSPILLGVLRPMILFPADIAAWTSPAERCAMLRHELAHVARRDHYVNLFQTIIGAVFFFHPLARYACRQLTLEREMACDDHVVGSGAEAEAYAESIVKAAERSIALAGAPGGAHQLALFSTRQILERRIEMILNKDRARVIAHQWRYLVLSAALIAAVSLLLISSHTGKIVAQPAIISNDEQTLIAMFRQAAEGITRDPGEDMFGEIDPIFSQNLTNETGEDFFRELDGLARQNFTVTRFGVDDFRVKINGATATVNFLGTIYLKDPVRGEEKSLADRFTVETVKVNGQWMAAPPPPPPPPPRKGKGVKNGDAPPPPPPPPQGQSEEQILLALIQEAFDSSITRDTSVYERLLADDFIGTGPDGQVTNKAQDIAQVKRQDITYTKIEIDDFRARIDGNSAVTNFLGTIFFKAHGEDSSVQYRYTLSLVKRNGRWLILAAHMSGK